MTNRRPFLLACMVAILLSVPTIARADVIRGLSGVSATVIDFEQFAGTGYNFTFGPVQLGGPVGMDVVFTANPVGRGISGRGSVLGSGGYGLGANGEWGGSQTYSGLDSSAGWMTYTFNSGPVASVGGFLNYAPGAGTNVSIEALDAAGNTLESYLLGQVAPIDTPGAVNAGAFRGISRATADIAAFRVSNQFVILDNLTFSPAPVPEPSTLVLLASGGLALFGRRARAHPPCFVPPRCCDIGSDVYRADGSMLCHANGGMTGGGDGRCPDFLSERTTGQIIWQDPRGSR